MLVAYVVLLGLTGWQFTQVARGFIPVMDQGYFINAVQLPPGSSLSRTDEVMKKVSARLMEVEGIAHVVAIAGLDGATFTGSSNTGVVFAILSPYARRGLSGTSTPTGSSPRCRHTWPTCPKRASFRSSRRLSAA